MKRRTTAVFAALALASLGLSSCGRTADALRILSANARFSQARYQEAIDGYLAAGPGRYDGIVDYDLATAFAALGEEESAAALFSRLASSPDPVIAASASYGLGLVAFGRADYDEAEARFRESLRLEPGAPDASRALEAAADAKRRSNEAKSASRAPTSTARGAGDELLDLAGRMESPRYKPGAQSAAEPSGDNL